MRFTFPTVSNSWFMDLLTLMVFLLELIFIVGTPVVFVLRVRKLLHDRQCRKYSVRRSHPSMKGRLS